MPAKRKIQDPKLHSLHLQYQRTRNQARFRGEEWNLSEQEWHTIWFPYWERRGRGGDELCLTRIDPEYPWQWNNVCIIAREYHLKIKNLRKHDLDYEHLYGNAEWIG